MTQDNVSGSGATSACTHAYTHACTCMCATLTPAKSRYGGPMIGQTLSRAYVRECRERVCICDGDEPHENSRGVRRGRIQGAKR